MLHLLKELKVNYIYYLERWHIKFSDICAVNVDYSTTQKITVAQKMYKKHDHIRYSTRYMPVSIVHVVSFINWEDRCGLDVIQ